MSMRPLLLARHGGAAVSAVVGAAELDSAVGNDEKRRIAPAKATKACTAEVPHSGWMAVPPRSELRHAGGPQTACPGLPHRGREE